MVRVLGLHAVVPGSNPVLNSRLDLFPVFPDSTLPLAYGGCTHSTRGSENLTVVHKWCVSGVPK